MTAPTAIAKPRTGSTPEFAPGPTKVMKPFPEYIQDVHGFAEIKKHNIEGIRGGLEQLADHLRAYTAKPDQPKPVFFLITYRYNLSVPNSGPLMLHALVLKPKPGVLETISEIKKVKGMPPRVTPATKPDDPREDSSVTRWLDGLGTWYSMGSEEMTTFSSRQWLTGERARGGPYLHPLPLQPFGHMAEVVMRNRFLKMFGKSGGITDITQNPLGSGAADVSWKEIAEYLYELANEIAVGSHYRS